MPCSYIWTFAQCDCKKFKENLGSLIKGLQLESDVESIHFRPKYRHTPKGLRPKLVFWFRAQMSAVSLRPCRSKKLTWNKINTKIWLTIIEAWSLKDVERMVTLLCNWVIWRLADMDLYCDQKTKTKNKRLKQTSFQNTLCSPASCNATSIL